MLRIGHHTVLGLCLTLFVTLGAAVVCLALLLAERQDTSQLLQHVSNLRQENTLLRSQLDDYRNDSVTQLDTAEEMPLRPDGAAVRESR
jgi:hypothetical protein